MIPPGVQDVLAEITLGAVLPDDEWLFEVQDGAAAPADLEPVRLFDLIDPTDDPSRWYVPIGGTVPLLHGYCRRIA